MVAQQHVDGGAGGAPAYHHTALLADVSESTLEHQRQESIAIVGIGCRFPGHVSSPSSLWDLLMDPVDLSAPIPSMRFSKDGFYHPEGGHHGATNSRRSYFLDDADVQKFDAAFFNISPKEAESMDPQHRLLLEVVYEGLEDAGISLSESSGTQTAAYVGLMTADWQDLQLRDIDGAPRYLVTGGARSIASNRLSYFFDWHGPSETIDTACSSSLVAVHHAVRALRSGEATMAVAAGTNLLLAPDMYVMTSNLNMLSATGKCHMWSSDADGYARGEGVACVILKTLSTALAAGDHIYAVVRETGVNQDGRTTGITMPSSNAQTRLIRDTYAKAGLDLARKEDQCQFFEAHGTGTPAGDPLEATAIWNAFFPSESTSNHEMSAAENDQLYVGSVKTVMGHLEGCAGLAGLVKATMALRNGVIPANLHLGTPNPKIAPFLGPKKLVVPTTATPWPTMRGDRPIALRRASVNSFGFGGTNAHVILESFDQNEYGEQRCTASQSEMCEKSSVPMAGPQSPPAVTIVLSATQESSLASLVARYADFIEKTQDIDLVRLSLTTQRRRTKLGQGITITGRTRAGIVRQMRTAVKAFEDGGQIGVLASSVDSNVGTGILGVFTGQGAQWACMGAKLIDSCPAFNRSIISLEGVLSATMISEAEAEGASAWSLTAALRAPAGQSHIGEAEFAQPLSTAVQIALVDTLRAAGVEFAAVVGHSSGELAAAYAAGCISAADAIRMAYYRGRYSKLGRSPHVDDEGKNGKGAMLAASLSWSDAEQLCSDEKLGFNGRVCVAANNAPKSVTLSGDLDKIREMQSLLQERNIACQMLRVDKAYHSSHMEVAGNAYREALSRCPLDSRKTLIPRGSQCIWVSSVYTDWEPITHDVIPESVQTAQYWVDNMLSPVRFRDALEKTPGLESITVGIEVGPHPALRRQVTDTLASLGKQIPYQGTLGRGADDNETFAGILGFLWQHGFPVDFDVMQHNNLGSKTTRGPESRHFASRTPLHGLPSMPWQHDRTYWRESGKLAQMIRRDTANELLGHCIERGLLGEWRWRQILRVNELPWLRGHKVQGQVVFPAAGYCVMAMDATKQLVTSLGDDGQPRVNLEVVELRDVEIGRAIVFPENNSDGVDVLTRLHDIRVRTRDLHLNDDGSSGTNSPPVFTFEAGFSIEAQLPAPATTDAMPPYANDTVHLHETSISLTYEAYSKIGLEYSAPFRVDALHRCLGRARSTVRHENVSTFETQHEEKDEVISTARSCFPVAALDNAFQTGLAAYTAPGDGRLLAPFLPRTIGKLRLHLGAYQASARNNAEFIFDASIRGHPESEIAQGREGNKTASWVACIEAAVVVTRYSTIFQVEDLKCVNLVPFEGPYQEGIFCEELWSLSPEDGLRDFTLEPNGPNDLQNFEIVEELANYYMCDVYSNFSKEEAAAENTPWFIRRFWDWLHYHLRGNDESSKPFTNPWVEDPARVERLMRRAESIKDQVEVKILHAVGQNILRVMRQQDGPTILEVLFQDDMLPRLYVEPVMYARANRYLGRVAKAISYQFPRCNILEIGAGTGGATQAMMAGLGGAYNSYTFTDISAGFFAHAKDKFANDIENMIFKTLDVEKNIEEQDFLPATYDIVVASNVLHATRDIERSLRNARKLLKPGGFLLLLEVTAVDKVLVPFLMGAVPGWWLYEDRWRSATFSPLLSKENWNQLMQKTGFSGGTEFAFHDMEEADDHLSSLMVGQAADDEWKSFRECKTTPTTKFRTDSLVIIAGGVNSEKESQISKNFTDNQDWMMSQLQSSMTLLNNESPLEVTVLYGLETAATSDLLERSMVVVLSDIQRPVLEDPKPSEWEAVKTVFTKTAHGIIWATRGRAYGREPSQSMIVGMGRCARYENPSLRLQFVDLDDETSLLAVQALCKIVWQARVLSPNSSDGPEGKSAWLHSVEHELAVENGRLMLPRLMPVGLSNERYMARDQCSSTRVLVFSNQVPDSPSIVDNGLGVFYLPSIDNHIWTTSSASVSFFSLLVEIIVANLLVRAKNGNGASTAAVMVFEPTITFERAVIHFAREHNKTVYIVTARKQEVEKLGSVTYLHPLMSSLKSRLLLRDNDGVYANLPFFRSSNSHKLMHSDDICFELPRRWKRISQTDLMVPNTKAGTKDRMGMVAEDFILPCHVAPIIEDSATLAAELMSDHLHVHAGSRHSMKTKLMSFVDFRRKKKNESYRPALVDWSSNTISSKSQLSLPHRLLPHPRRLFNPDKTYFFAGITSDLGLSVAKWMISNGARSVALASRAPKIPQTWLDEMGELSMGCAIICTFAMDATSKDSVRRVCDEIAQTMAPVAGIVYGAMVLKDALLESMPFDDLKRTMDPKVKGSYNVEQYFHDTPLDFFIFMGSMSAIVGIRGQSNYCAGNMFGRSLVAARRARGLAASTVDLSTVFGVGYFANAGAATLQTVNSNLRGFNTLPIGEADVLDAFHEAILRGPPNASLTGDVIVGLGSETAVPSAQPAAWHDDPRFGHFTSRASSRNKNGAQGGSKGAGVAADRSKNVREKLAKSSTEEQRLATLSGCFAAQIQETMQLPETSLRAEVPLSDLGIDSLVAVDLRTWFFKELEVSVPVLSILNGESIRELCKVVLSQLQAVK
ncbi:hypothetical protein LZ30DRAFT_650197 [Colletotrichum cereale]|nr:hypothetical protein LZ30DRAFT_650197 [Colletotrichum cereale]